VKRYSHRRSADTEQTIRPAAANLSTGGFPEALARGLPTDTDIAIEAGYTTQAADAFGAVIAT
jgi:hypothetical protein